MFLKLLVSLFSILVFVKNISYSVYEYRDNENTVGAFCVVFFSLLSITILNIVLFFIKF